MGFDVPHRYRFQILDSIAPVGDGSGCSPLHPAVEIKSYRDEDVKYKKNSMDTFWVPVANNLGGFGRRVFAEFTDVWTMVSDFESVIAAYFDGAPRGLAARQQPDCTPPLNSTYFNQCRKIIESGEGHWNLKPKSSSVNDQCNYQVIGIGNDNMRFMIYPGQNLEDPNDFSCGMSYLAGGALPLMQARCNEPGHIHRATKRAIAASN